MNNFKSWKTSLAGLLTLLPQILHLLFPKQVSSQTADALSALFASCGLAVSKDHDVTGNPAVTIGEDVPEKPENNLPKMQVVPEDPLKKN